MAHNSTIYTDGVFDLFHYGHSRLLERCAHLGDRLIVGVHNDVDAETRKRRPTMTMAERIEVVQACRCVDTVIPNAPLKVTKNFLEDIGADLVAHGHTEEEHEMYTRVYDKLPLERVDYTPGISTTLIIDRL